VIASIMLSVCSVIILVCLEPSAQRIARLKVTGKRRLLKTTQMLQLHVAAMGMNNRIIHNMHMMNTIINSSSSIIISSIITINILSPNPFLFSSAVCEILLSATKKLKEGHLNACCRHDYTQLLLLCK
jgi:hypothetical protein